jgi:hypothetical protein
MRRFVVVYRKVQLGKISWRTLGTSDQKKMAAVGTMLATAGNQGHAHAQHHLADMVKVLLKTKRKQRGGL